MVTVRVFLIYLFFLFFILNSPSIVFSKRLYNPSSLISGSAYSYAIPDFSSEILYSNLCREIPQSEPTPYLYSPSSYPQFSRGYYIGGDKLINPNPQLSPNFPKDVSFHANYLFKTNTEDVFLIHGVLTFTTLRRYPNVSFGGSQIDRKFPLGMDGIRMALTPIRLRFSLNGFWSQSSGKLCMVGSGNWYSKEGKLVRHYVVFKLNSPLNSNISTSFVSGTLESVNKTGSSNFFEPISVLAFSQLNYDYTLILNESTWEFSSLGDGMKGLPLSLVSSLGVNQDNCAILRKETWGVKLDYESDCNEANNCSPIGGNGFLPTYMSFRGIHCSEDLRLRLLIGFYNSIMYDNPFGPDRMLVGEGAWDAENNRLNLVVCQILNATVSLVDYTVGECSIRLSLWFPAVLSLKTRSTAVGLLWSNRKIGDSGYFQPIRFRSWGLRELQVPGLKYEYTESGRVRKLCVEKKTGRDKGKAYPGKNSYDLKFVMGVGNGKQGWGNARPLTVGDEFYEKSGLQLGPMARDSSVNGSGNPNILLNISYLISFTPPIGSKLFGQHSAAPAPNPWSPLVDITAEGIYDTGTGALCMIGCRFLGPDYRKSSKTNLTDCEILINVQFSETNEKHKSYVSGSIESTRRKSDPLYFDHLDFASLSLSKYEVSETVWRMDVEVTMVLIAKTLICLFVVSQLFYVKKHPDILPSISLLMLIILTHGQLIPLLLNFEALFLPNRNHKNIIVGSGGLLEMNEVLVKGITMIAFLLQFYLLKLAWSTRLSDGNRNDLWLAEEKSIYVFLPFCVVSGVIAWLIHGLSNPVHTYGQTILENLRSYAGLLLDGFLLPQILLNVFWNSNDKSLSPSFYFGTTAVRLLPHVYDFYRANRFASSSYDRHSIYANPHGGFFTSTWDIIIPCGGLLFAMVIHFQQRFGGLCILPPSFRAYLEYEKVPVESTTVTGE